MDSCYIKYTDTALLELLRNDDNNAFDAIYRRYWEKLFAVANNRLKNRMEAEEVVQDVFFSIWKRRAELDIEHTLNTYLSVAVKYQILNRQASAYHKAQKNRIGECGHAEPAADTTQLWFNARELQHQLLSSINRLPEKCKIVFLKSREHGKTNTQIADELNISVKAVEAHVTRALHILRNALGISLPVLLHLLLKEM